VQDGEVFWLVKPTISSDTSNVALLEHACMQMGLRAQLNMAKTYVHKDDTRTAVLVKRFDRFGNQRHMVLSGASLLQTEYPANTGRKNDNSRWSYPLLAQTMRAIGAPDKDLIELFGRMLFNALIGNDDDHPRNHAVVWNQSERKWRLSPAFDVVPNMTETPKTLSMQLSQGRWDISNAALFADWKYFGFSSLAQAYQYANELIVKIKTGSLFLEETGLFSDDAELIRLRIQDMAQKII
jgi:serine/threonine-protein kinase HipA